jgi:hypothetical protein
MVAVEGRGYLFSASNREKAVVFGGSTPVFGCPKLNPSVAPPCSSPRPFPGPHRARARAITPQMVQESLEPEIAPPAARQRAQRAFGRFGRCGTKDASLHSAPAENRCVPAPATWHPTHPNPNPFCQRHARSYPHLRSDVAVANPPQQLRQAPAYFPAVTAPRTSFAADFWTKCPEVAEDLARSRLNQQSVRKPEIA